MLKLLSPALRDNLLQKVRHVSGNQAHLRTHATQHGIADRIRVHCNHSQNNIHIGRFWQQFSGARQRTWWIQKY